MINFRFSTPTRHETYRQSRRDSLNFENCGGERHAGDDSTLGTLGPIYDFLARAASHVGARQTKG
ncbi:MAG: hypothetical protein ABSC34_05025 [Acidimicrobiales bacterium]|jgi:hypothetical protein